MKYINAEESAYRKLQRVLKDALQEGTDEYSEDDQASDTNKFQLPKNAAWLAFHATCFHSCQRAQWDFEHVWMNEY